MNPTQKLKFEASPKRIRAVTAGATIADTLDAVLVLEKDHSPVYYFPRSDVRLDLLERSSHGTRCPLKGDASYWTIDAGAGRIENAAWSYDNPIPASEPIKGYIAFYWSKVDHWFEENEEVFGHPRDPYHRVDVRASSREVTVAFGSETVARTRRGLFLFETGLPTRYYIPSDDVLAEFLTPSPRTSICPYKGTASYYSLKVRDRIAADAVWVYKDPLPECPRIKDHLCFYPEKVDSISVEGK